MRRVLGGVFLRVLRVKNKVEESQLDVACASFINEFFAAIV